VNPSIDDDDVQFIMILKNGNILQRISVDKDAIGVVSRLNLPKLVAPHQEGSNASRGSNNALVRGETEELDEMFKIASICSVWRPGKTVVAVYVSTSLVQLAVT
jgi:uncharacterized membrane protein